jgi:general secretion pathway protein D
MRIWFSVLLCAAVLALPAVPSHAAAQNAETRISLYFINSEVSKVLNSLARKAKANIVIPVEDKTKITVTLNNVTVDEAVRTVAVQAGLAYRRIGNTFIVGKYEDMAKALEQEGITENVDVANADPAAVAKSLKEAVPFLTVHQVGRTLELLGAPVDIESAKRLLTSLDVPVSPGVPTATETLSLTNQKATEVEGAINNEFGKGTAQSVGETKLIITAPEGEIQRVRDQVLSLDTLPEANLSYVVYHVKFANARALTLSLRSALQNITVVSGPEPFYIPKTTVNLLSTGIAGFGTTSGTSGSSGSSSGLGSSGGGSSLGSSGTSGTSDQSGYGGAGGGGGTGGTQQQNGIRARTLIIGGPDATVKAALKLLEQIDTPTPQVAIEVKVISTNPQTTQNLGLQWFNGTNGNTEGQISTSVQEGPNGGNPIGNAFRNNFGFGSLARLPISFNVALNAFFQRTDVRILAKPTITALDNEEGVIFVGQTNRVLTAVITGSTTNIVTNQIVEIPTGIILQMTPRIIDDHSLMLRVHPIVSESTGPVTAGGIFNSLVREADTTVRVTSGETIVIGGLLQDEDTKVLDKIPILGDIPLIGQFFRNHSHTHNRQEVMVFVTPHLIKD